MLKKQQRKILQGTKVISRARLPSLNTLNVHNALEIQQQKQQQKFQRQFYRYNSDLKKKFPVYFDKQKKLNKEKVDQQINMNRKNRTKNKSLPILSVAQLSKTKKLFEKQIQNKSQIFPVELKHMLIDKHGFDSKEINQTINDKFLHRPKQSFYQQRLSKVYPVNLQDRIDKQFQRLSQRFMKNVQQQNIKDKNIGQKFLEHLQKDKKQHRETLLQVMKNFSQKQIKNFLKNRSIDFNLQQNLRQQDSNEKIFSYHQREEKKNQNILEQFSECEKKIEKQKQPFQNATNEIFSYSNRFKYKPPHKNTFKNIKRKNENEFKVYDENVDQNLDQFRTLTQKQDNQTKKEKLNNKLDKISVNKFKETKIIFQQLIYGIYLINF